MFNELPVLVYTDLMHTGLSSLLGGVFVWYQYLLSIIHNILSVFIFMNVPSERLLYKTEIMMGHSSLF